MNDKTQHPVRAMFQSRAFFKAIAYEKKLYVFGGKPDKHTVINYVEIYDPETDEWRVTSPMNEKRQSFGVSNIVIFFYLSKIWDS